MITTKTYYKLIRVTNVVLPYLTITNTSGGDGSFSVSKTGSLVRNLEYSLNGENWTTYDLTNLPTVSVPANGSIYLRGNNQEGFNKDAYNCHKLNMNVEHTVSGNPLSLRNTDPEVFANYTSTLEGEFYSLFDSNTNLSDASGLDMSQITNIGNYCFFKTFYGCTSLTAAPNFANASSIGNFAFNQTFCNCTSLTDGSDFSSVLIVNTETFALLYQGCTSLVTPPNFNSVTSIAYKGFFIAFKGCELLTTTPVFNNVTNVGSSGLEGAFQNCSNLSTVTAPNVSTWNTSGFGSWLTNAGISVSGTKTFYAPEGVTIPTADNGIPSGWTRVDY